MNIKQGARVVTKDGEEVGTIDRVVIDPRSKDVTHVIVQKGLLFREDKVVPIDLIRETEENKVVVRADREVFESLSDFRETNYVSLDEDELSSIPYPEGYATPMYFYPASGGVQAGAPGYYGAHLLDSHQQFREETVENIPPQTVPLKEGAKVISADRQHVGELEEVRIDAESDEVTHVVISKGLLGKKKKLVPVSWIHSISEEEVRLSPGSGMIAKLPDYEE